MNRNDRTYNAFVNVSAAIVGQIISIVISLVSRFVFIRQLGEVYLGVNGLFTNVVGLLSFAELGVGTAINYRLYKPLSENNIPHIKSLMALYKKVYYVIGAIIFFLGISILPFLPLFLKTVDEKSIDHLYLIFILYVFNSSVSYFFSFKRALIISDQKRYIATIYRYVFYVIMNIFQMVVLLLYESFIGYILIMIACTLAENISISYKADKMYPYLKEKDSEKLNEKDKVEIKNNTLALMFHRVGSIMVNSTDNILISKLVGLVYVGVYSNYQLLTSSLNIIISQLFTALTASIGNLGATESKEKAEFILYKIFFINFCISAVVCATLYSSADILIETWLGKKMILGKNVLVCIVANFYLYQIRKTVLTFRDAYGVFWHDRYKALAEAAINLIISILLGLKIGIVGILVGTIVSTLLTSVWIEPHILFKYIFKRSAWKYYKRAIIYTIVTVGCCLFCDILVGKLDLIDVYGCFISVIISVISVLVIITLLFSRTEDYQYLVKLLCRQFKARR